MGREVEFRKRPRMFHVEMVSNGMSIPEEDRQSVLQLSADLDRTWDSRDAREFAALFDDNGDFRFQDGLWVQGKDAIEGFWGQEVFPNLPEGMRHISITKRVRFVSDNVAIGDGTLRLVRIMEGQEQVYLETEGTVLAVKKEERWRISAIRLTVLSSG
jgi:uncharacterized protein (TIGR02246 family)